MMNDLIYWTAFFGGAALFCYGVMSLILRAANWASKEGDK